VEEQVRKTSASPKQVTLVESLFLSNSEAIRSFLFALAPSRDGIDDVLHATFVRAVEKADDFREGTNFLSWARTIARYVLLQTLRAETRHLQALSPELLETLAEDAPQFDLSEDRLAALEECFRQLAPHSAKVVSLRYYESLSPAAIASRLGQKVESIYVTLSRGRAFLRECVERKSRSMEGRL